MSPNPSSLSVPSARTLAAFKTAAGVGINIPFIKPSALFMPFASTILFINICLISSLAGSTFNTLSLGITFSVILYNIPALSNISAISSLATLFPATTTGSLIPCSAIILALWIMHSLLPPLVPPAKSIISKLEFFISSISLEVKS
ncbi:hypothetical protein SDC9_132271 [bioreactor metagenome]|uniref:Uncharacterized protein n=1 Tax=bioreactor metagenome TaxID=1076179 RepID=A0A645D8C3_9ZZZZ